MLQVYAAVARAAFGRAPGHALKAALTEDEGECARDLSAFICHPFARPMHMKQRLAEVVSRRGRARLLALLAEQQMTYRRMDEALLAG